MWAKPVLLSALVAASVFTTPAGLSFSQHAAFQPQWVLPAQDRREDLRDLREILAELRARYGGELVSATPISETVYEIRWRDRNGEIHVFRIDRRR
ncbi:MAG: hypothetical protein AB7T59_10620 [Hyphomonadaceae bacterium]